MAKSLFLLLIVGLSACGGGDGTSLAPATGAKHCGLSVGAGRISGTVTSVYDGDTLTLAGQTIRLDSIDAPELSQAYGEASRDQLAAWVLGQRVTVTYAKTDRYDRVVGTVFTLDGRNTHLRQVAAGAAWYYEAYRCEIDSRQRTALAAAQASAKAAALGLWAAPAVAPWMHRNGTEPQVPETCPNGDAAND